MITLIQGRESYRRSRELQVVLDNNRDAKVSFFNLASSDTLSSILNEIGQKSIFQEKKLIVIFNLFKKTEKKEINLLLERLKSVEAVIIEEEVVKVPKSIDRVVNAEPVKDIEKWIRDYNGEMEPSAAKLLSLMIGNDLWALSNEIDKVATYKKGGQINKDDIYLLVKPKVEIGAFDLINALARRERREALRFIYAQLENGESLLSILARVNSQFRNLVLVKNDSGTAKELNLHPYFFKKTSEYAKRFSSQELKKIYEKIFFIERDIKTGKIESDLALDLLIFSL